METAQYYETATETRPRTVTPVFVILVCVILLLAVGIPTVYSASAATSSATLNLAKQIVGAGFGAFMALLVSRLDLEYLRKFTVPLFVVAVLLLVLTLVPGLGQWRNGSRRWLGYGPLAFQTSEFAKVALIFVLAHYLAIKQTHNHKFLEGFFYPLLIIAALALPISQQKDIGTATLIFGIGIVLLFLAGTRIRHLATAIPLGAAGVALLVVTSQNRMERLMAWFNHDTSKLDGGWQLEQALSAFAVGGVTGVGPGQGRQQLAFLPEAHTDFILPVIGEELGLIGTLGVVALFLTIFIAGLVHLRRAPNQFQYILTAGALLFLIMPALVNFYVVTGLGPTKGMSLPFVSYGMSNLIIAGVFLGIFINNQRNWPRPPISNRERLLKNIAS